jgi:hypothetical protein
MSFHSLLEGMQNDIVVFEDSWAVSYKNQYNHNKQPS